jgi:hypothetical protein
MYTFNQARKRLEPIHTKCQYCDAAHSSDMEENYFVPLFKEQDRTNIVIYRSVKYQKIPVGIPRCSGCMEIHEGAASRGNLIAWVSAILIEILCFNIDMVWGFVAILPCLFLVIAGSDMIAGKIIREKGILTKLQGAKKSEVVQDLVISGWSFTQPSA